MPDKKPYATDIPAEILKHRERLEMTQAEFAKKCGLSQPAISAAELGNYEPRLKTLRKIASAIGKTLIFGDKSGRIFR